MHFQAPRFSCRTQIGLVDKLLGVMGPIEAGRTKTITNSPRFQTKKNRSLHGHSSARYRGKGAQSSFACHRRYSCHRAVASGTSILALKRGQSVRLGRSTGKLPQTAGQATCLVLPCQLFPKSDIKTCENWCSQPSRMFRAESAIHCCQGIDGRDREQVENPCTFCQLEFSRLAVTPRTHTTRMEVRIRS